MGLNEKRKIKELQDTVIPGRTKELNEIFGGAAQYQINWDSFANDMEALNFFDNLACHRINMALRTICVDDFTKEAVRDGLRAIALTNVKTKDEMKMSFSGGMLEMSCAYGLRLDGIYQDNEIAKALGDGL
jgi:hypothetical protein